MRLLVVPLGPVLLVLWMLLRTLWPASPPPLSPAIPDSPSLTDPSTPAALSIGAALQRAVVARPGPAATVAHSPHSLRPTTSAWATVAVPSGEAEARRAALAILRNRTTLSFEDAPCSGNNVAAHFDLREDELHLDAALNGHLPAFQVRLQATEPGRVYLVRGMTKNVSFVADVEDLHNGTYLCRFPSLALFPDSVVPINAYVMHACSRTLYDYHCSYNYTGSHFDKCPLQGRDPRSADVGKKVASLRLFVHPTAAVRAAAKPACGGAHRGRLPGTWRRRRDVNVPAWAMVNGGWVGDSLTVRADYAPAPCRLRAIDYPACVQRRFFVFLGDSTLRNIFYCVARAVLNVTDTGAVRQSSQLEALAPKWNAVPGKKVSDWQRKEGNMVTRQRHNPVYFAWAAHMEQPPPELPEFFAAFQRWRSHLGLAGRPITVLWSLGAHAPGVNVSTLYIEVLRYAHQFRKWMDRTGSEVYHINVKAVRKLVKGQAMASYLHPAYNNPRIHAKNILAAELLGTFGIPTIDLFSPTLAYWTNWEFVQDGIHYKDWVDTVLRDIVFQTLCPAPARPST